MRSAEAAADWPEASSVHWYCPAFGVAGAYVLVIVIMILCMVLITERSFFEDFRRTGKKVYKNMYENNREEAAIRREQGSDPRGKETDHP